MYINWTFKNKIIQHFAVSQTAIHIIRNAHAGANGLGYRVDDGLILNTNLVGIACDCAFAGAGMASKSIIAKKSSKNLCDCVCSNRYFLTNYRRMLDSQNLALYNDRESVLARRIRPVVCGCW